MASESLELQQLRNILGDADEQYVRSVKRRRGLEDEVRRVTAEIDAAIAKRMRVEHRIKVLEGRQR